MSLTVRQLLKTPELSGMELICGSSGLDRVISSVNVMEAPDIAQWLHGGELLLSTGYQFRKQPEEFGELVMSVNNAGASALGFKNRFLHQFPSRAKDLAEWLGLPILGLPLKLAYSDIIRIVILKTDEVENIRSSESILRSFSQIITEGGGVEKILQNLMYFIKCKACFLDAFTGRCYSVSDDEVFSELAGVNADFLLKKYPHECLSLSNATYGYFIFENYPVDALGRVVIEHAKTAMLLAMQKEIATKQVESRYRDEFVQDLLTNNIRYHEEILNRAARFGWDLAGSLCCVVFSIDDYKRHFEQPLSEKMTQTLEETRQRIYLQCKQEMRQVFREKIPYSTMSDSIAFILNPNKFGNFKSRITFCAEQIRSKVSAWTDFTVTTGVGEEKNNFFGCAESYEEAKSAIEMMRPLSGGNTLYFWENLGAITVLSLVCKTDEARKFCCSRLGRIIRDGEQNRDMLSTLRVLIEENWNFKSAADRLHIHYNTVRYRCEKLTELLNMNLSDSNCRQEAALALKIYDINPSICDL